MVWLTKTYHVQTTDGWLHIKAKTKGEAKRIALSKASGRKILRVTD